MFTLHGICLLELASKLLFKGVLGSKVNLPFQSRFQTDTHVIICYMFSHSFAIYLLVCHLPCLSSPSPVPMQARVISSKHRGPLVHIWKRFGHGSFLPARLNIQIQPRCVWLNPEGKKGGELQGRVRVYVKDRTTSLKRDAFWSYCQTSCVFRFGVCQKFEL